MIAQVFPETKIVVAAMGISLALAILLAVWLWRSISTISNLRAAQNDFEHRLAVEEQKVSRIPNLELSLRDKEAQLEQLRHGKAAIQAELATSTEALARTIQKSEEQLASLRETTEQMKKEFTILADQVLSGQNETRKQQNKEQIDGTLMPLREKLPDFDGDMSDHQSNQRGMG
jgi:DNA anti-recombination protein RmuC